MALEPCPHCNRGFDHDNAGARQNHLEACPYNPKNMPDTSATEPSEESKPQQVQRPRASNPDGATPNMPLFDDGEEEEQPSQGVREVPANVPGQQREGELPAAQSANAIEAGLQSAPAISTLIGGSRGEQLQTLAGVLAATGEHVMQRDQQAKERAKNTSQDQIRAVDSYPRCEVCDAQLTNLPEPGVEFECPGCGEILVS